MRAPKAAAVLAEEKNVLRVKQKTMVTVPYSKKKRKVKLYEVYMKTCPPMMIADTTMAVNRAKSNCQVKCDSQCIASARPKILRAS